MDINIYKKLLEEFVKSANSFDGVSKDEISELEEDFITILETIDITKHESNIDGVMKSTSDLITELMAANSQHDKQKCIESLAMLRARITDIESAFSNAADSLEKLVVSIRDA